MPTMRRRNFVTPVAGRWPCRAPPARAQRELPFHIALSTSLAVTQGYGADEVGRAYAQAYAQGEQLGETAQLSPVLFGLWRFHSVRGELHTGRAFGEELLRHAERLQDPIVLMEAHYTLGTSAFFLGEYVTALEHLEQTLALYEPRQGHTGAFVLGFDLGVAGLSYVAVALWTLGYPDQAWRQVQKGLKLARKLAHPHSLVIALYFVARLDHLCGNIQAVQEHVEAAISLSRDHSFMHRLALSLHLWGWALIEQECHEEDMEQLRQGLASRGGIGTIHPYLLALLAEAHARVGQPEQGLIVLAEAFELAETTGGHWWDAELHRVTGELLLQADDGWEKAKRAPRVAFSRLLKSRGVSKPSLRNSVQPLA